MMYYFHDDKFAYVAMDTDWVYFATSDSLEKDIKNWNMDIFGKDAFQFHKRAPGLYKDEFQGTGIIDLYAQTLLFLEWKF